jgi:hypothetical protein
LSILVEQINNVISLNLTKNPYNINIIFNFVFLTEDLESLLDKLKDLKVNKTSR